MYAMPQQLMNLYTYEHLFFRFLSKNLVEKHISFIHKKEVVSVCDVCGRTFSGHARMLAHKIIHIKENLVSCPKCPKKFVKT